MKNLKWLVLIMVLCVLAAAAAQSAQTTVFTAAEAGDLETVSRLLKADAKLVAAKNAEGDTALHIAAGCRRGEEAALPIVRLLLESGAEVDARNPSNQTPLLYSAYAGFRRVVELFLEKGAAFQYQDSYGRSPLHYAAREGRPAVVELLVQKGADPSLKDGEGRTPLEYAVLRDRRAVVETLMNLVAYDVKGADGSLLLHAAAAQGSDDMVQSLIEKGADPGRPGPNGVSILISYLRGGLAARAIESVAKGADVNARDAAGRPALSLAVEKGMEDAAKALLDKGADPNAADKSGRTAMDIAQDWGSGALASLLTAKGARPVRARAHALKGGSYEIVERQPGGKEEAAIIRYIGTDGFLIQAGSKAVLVDGLVRNPWGYTDTPARALALMKAAQPPFERIDLLLFSHAHRDHFEPRMALDVLSSHPGAILVGDGLVSKDLQEAGAEDLKALGSRVKIMDIKIGERTNVVLNGIPLTALGVNHANRERAYMTMGYIVDLGPFRIYHQGDIFPDVNIPFLSSIPWEKMKIDIAFFDPFFLQNEAARRIALDRVQPSAIILMHMRDDEGERYFNELRPTVPQVVVFGAPMESKRFVKDSAVTRRP